MAKSNVNALRLWAFKSLEKIFGSQNWKSVERSASMLKLMTAPNVGVRHTLLVKEPVDLAEVNGKNAIALTSDVLVWFSKLERFIDVTLGRDPDTTPELTVSLPLMSYAPAPSRYVIIEKADIDGDALERKIQLFMDYHDKYVEPTRKKLESVDVFREDYRPSISSFWYWSIRRVAYHQIYSDEGTRRECCIDLREKARSFLSGDVLPLLRSSKI